MARLSNFRLQNSYSACWLTLTLFAAVPGSANGADLPVAVSGASQMHADTSVISPSVLESSGAVVGNVRINAGSIFDLDDPEEDRVLYRLANRLHVTTRNDVIEQQLLFRAGEPFSAQKIEESALPHNEIPVFVIEFLDANGKPECELAVVPTYALEAIGKANG